MKKKKKLAKLFDLITLNVILEVGKKRKAKNLDKTKSKKKMTVSSTNNDVGVKKKKRIQEDQI